MAPNRNNRIRRQVETGGVDPKALPNYRPPSFQERREARQRYNQRVRKINARKRERAQQINERRRAAAQAEFGSRTTAPDISSNENYQRSLSDIENQYQQTGQALDQQEAGLGISYGLGQYGADIASNPYSRAAMLQRSYNQNQRASVNTMASRGQLYSGATQNQANANASNYGSAYDALSKDYGARLSQIGIQRQEAQNRAGDAKELAASRAKAEAAKLFPVTRENAPRMPEVKRFTPTFKKLRPPVRRPRPNPNRNRPRNPGPTGGVRP